MPPRVRCGRTSASERGSFALYSSMDTRHRDARRSSHPLAIRGLRGLLRVVFLVAWAVSPLAAQRPDSTALRHRIEALVSGLAIGGGEGLLEPEGLTEFYGAGGFTAVWHSADGARRPRADSALTLLRRAGSHGLDAREYHLSALDRLTERVQSRESRASDVLDAEILLTDALLHYGTHLLRGRADPSRLDPDWIADRRLASVASRLAHALEAGGIDGFDESLAPPHAGYARLRGAYARLWASRLWGGWGVVDDGPTLRVDSVDSRVEAVRRRLRLSTDSAERRLASEGAGSALFDRALEEAVRRFQRRHGLAPDGLVGARTRAAMNVPVSDRIRQVAINLERWRWLPDDLGRRHIRVNIAAFEAELWEDDTATMRSRTIVGRQDRMTPGFNSTMSHLVLAPYWYVPPTIAAEDKLPLIQSDPGYVAASRMTLFDASSRVALDPASIEWAGMTGAEFNRRFLLRQDPGPGNALGLVKFVFPNRHSVYLHDTPQKGLFAQATRALSSGCVRLERAIDLAEALLRDRPEWPPARIREVVSEGAERRVDLTRPVPVYLLYFTAFVESDGTLHLRPDIYGRDAELRAALDAAESG